MAAVQGEGDHLFGLHDLGGENHMLANKGWLVSTEKIGHIPGAVGAGDFRHWINGGFGVIVRLNNGYGADGTIPYESQYLDFAKCAAEYIVNMRSRGRTPLPHVWVIGNETNLASEWPRYGTQPQNITPERYSECFRLVRNAIKAEAPRDQVVMQGVSPAVTPEYPDPIAYYRSILTTLGAGNVDGIALHTYSGGTNSTPAVDDEFRKYRAFLRATPEWARFLPVYITETNPRAWDNVNRGWVKAAYWEIDRWNRIPAQQTVRALALYRWEASAEPEWAISTRPEVIADFSQAGQRSYHRWITYNVPHGRFFLQSTSGLTGNFECVVGHLESGFFHCWRDNDSTTPRWHGFERFGQSLGRVGSASVIQSNYAGNLEVIGRIGHQMVHFFRDSSGWHQNGGSFGFGLKGAASFIQSRHGARGDFQVVVPHGDGGFAHYRRKNDSDGQQFQFVARIDAGQPVDAVSLIQSTYGNLEVVALVRGELWHYYCVIQGDNVRWIGPTDKFGPRDGAGTAIAMGSPGFIQARYPGTGNFVVITPMTTGGVAMFARENDKPLHPWVFRQSFGGTERIGAVSVLHSTYGPSGNLEAVARAASGRLYHWWRDTAVSPPTWRGPVEIGPSPTGESIEA